MKSKLLLSTSSIVFLWYLLFFSKTTYAEIATIPSLKVAFVADMGITSNSYAVVRLMRDEGAQLVVVAGDFDYTDNPNAWATMMSELGPTIPYVLAIGNHDDARWSGYQSKFQNQVTAHPDLICSGDLGINSTCSYKGLYLIQSGIGQRGSNHVSYLQSQLSQSDHIWRICTWHKNRVAMQVGNKLDDVPWDAYEACRTNGALIINGHEHAYERTKTLVNFPNQTIHPIWQNPQELLVSPGSSFVTISALGGSSSYAQTRCLPSTYPYGCNGIWAKIYGRTQNAQYGALFITFNTQNDPRKASAYFKTINGDVIDQFTIRSENSLTVVTPTVSPTVSPTVVPTPTPSPTVQPTSSLPPTSTPMLTPTITPTSSTARPFLGCENERLFGNYDCSIDQLVNESDFIQWKTDYVSRKSTLSDFEYVRRN